MSWALVGLAGMAGVSAGSGQAPALAMLYNEEARYSGIYNGAGAGASVHYYYNFWNVPIIRMFELFF